MQDILVIEEPIFEQLFDQALEAAHHKRTQGSIQSFDESNGAADAILVLHDALLHAMRRGGTAELSGQSS